jgi:beta-alanine--pyruvate transaminase
MQYAANTLENHWMPFTSNREFKAEPRLMVKAQGMHCRNRKGEKLIDASSGPFCGAAGIAALEFYEKEGLFKCTAEMSPRFPDRMYSLGPVKAVTDVRGIDVAPAPRPGLRGSEY